MSRWFTNIPSNRLSAVVKQHKPKGISAHSLSRIPLHCYEDDSVVWPMQVTCAPKIFSPRRSFFTFLGLRNFDDSCCLRAVLTRSLPLHAQLETSRLHEVSAWPSPLHIQPETSHHPEIFAGSSPDLLLFRLSPKLHEVFPSGPLPFFFLPGTWNNSTFVSLHCSLIG